MKYFLFKLIFKRLIMRKKSHTNEKKLNCSTDEVNTFLSRNYLFKNNYFNCNRYYLRAKKEF